MFYLNGWASGEKDFWRSTLGDVKKIEKRFVCYFLVKTAFMSPRIHRMDEDGRITLHQC